MSISDNLILYSLSSLMFDHLAALGCKYSILFTLLVTIGQRYKSLSLEIFAVDI